MIWRGVVYRDYDAAGLDKFEVCVADGCITTNFDTLPDDLTAYQARLVANMLVAAADELEPPETITAKGRGILRGANYRNEHPPIPPRARPMEGK